MIKLAKMEIYHLFHKTSTDVMLIIICFFTFFMTFITKIDLGTVEKFSAEDQEMIVGALEERMDDLDSYMGLSEEDFAHMSEEEAAAKKAELAALMDEMQNHTALADDEPADDEPVIGISASPNESWAEGEVPLEDFINSMLTGSGVMLLFCAILTAMYVNAEQKNGYVKNIAGQIPGRYMLALSKFIGVAVQTALLLAVAAVSSFVSGKLIFRGDIWMTVDGGKLVRILALEYLFHFAFSCAVAMICLITRSMAASMAFGIMMSSGIPVLLGMAANILLHKLIPATENFNINRYTIETKVQTFTLDAGGGWITEAVLVAVGYIAVSTVVSAVLVQKRDVR